MRSSYKNPGIWMMVVIGIMFAILGKMIEINMESDWKYLFFGMKPGGIMIAVFFAFCAFANFVGTLFVVDKPFTRSWPSMIVVIAALVAVISLFVVMVVGIENKFGLWLLFGSTGGLMLSVPTAFFIRGMAKPSQYDR